MKINVFCALALLFSYFHIQSQEYAPVEDPDLIEKYSQSLVTLYPHLSEKITLKGVFDIGDRYRLINFTDGEEDYETIVNSGREDMMIVAEFRRIPKEEIPKIVMDQLKKEDLDSWNYQKGFEYEKPGSHQMYAIEVSNDDKSKRLYFDALGHPEENPI